MADDAKTYDIEVRTRYDGKGMEEARTDLANPPDMGGAAGSAGAGVSKVDYGALAAKRVEAEKAMAGASAETLAAETQQTIELEKQIVVSTRRAALEASISGNKTEFTQSPHRRRSGLKEAV